MINITTLLNLGFTIQSNIAYKDLINWTQIKVSPIDDEMKKWKVEYLVKSSLSNPSREFKKVEQDFDDIDVLQKFIKQLE
jgi:hypothetical protein